MSLVIAIKAADAIILAGDTRGTTGDPRGLTAISDIYKKIGKLSNYCGVGFAGSSELGVALLDKDASALSEYLIFETATQDPKVGGAINMPTNNLDQEREVNERA
jgi:20S proteasome alpha/beta subunit